MNPGFLKSRIQPECLVSRIQKVLGWKLTAREMVQAADRVTLATSDSGNADRSWRGHCIFVIGRDGRTIIDNLSGFLGTVTKDQWIEIADGESLEFQEFNDAIGYGTLVSIENGKITRFCLFDEGDGLKESTDSTITSWIDVAAVVERDDDLYTLEEGLGTLLVFETR